MTTVIAVAREGQAWMAADSMTNVYDRPVYGARKISRIPTRHSGDLLVGCSGDGGGNAALERSWSVEALPGDGDRQSWAAACASAITEIYVEHGLIEHGRLDGSLMLAIPGHLWTVVHNQAIYHPDGIAAIGSGEGPAMGVAHALSGRPPEQVVAEACRVGILLDQYSGGDILVEGL